MRKCSIYASKFPIYVPISPLAYLQKLQCFSIKKSDKPKIGYPGSWIMKTNTDPLQIYVYMRKVTKSAIYVMRIANIADKIALFMQKTHLRKDG